MSLYGHYTISVRPSPPTGWLADVHRDSDGQLVGSYGPLPLDQAFAAAQKAITDVIEVTEALRIAIDTCPDCGGDRSQDLRTGEDPCWCGVELMMAPDSEGEPG